MNRDEKTTTGRYYGEALDHSGTVKLLNYGTCYDIVHNEVFMSFTVKLPGIPIEEKMGVFDILVEGNGVNIFQLWSEAEKAFGRITK